MTAIANEKAQLRALDTLHTLVTESCVETVLAEKICSPCVRFATAFPCTLISKVIGLILFGIFWRMTVCGLGFRILLTWWLLNTLHCSRGEPCCCKGNGGILFVSKAQKCLC